MVADYTVQTAKVVDEFMFYGQRMLKYQVTLDTGEIVFYNRSKLSKTSLQIGDKIHGEIEDVKGEKFLRLRRLKRAELSADTDDIEKAIDIKGSGLWVTYVESMSLEQRSELATSMENYIAEFRRFQEMLKK